MDQEINVRKIPSGEGEYFMLRRFNFTENGLVDNKFMVKDSYLSKKLCESVLDRYQSQGTQTIERRRASAPIDNEKWNEQLKRSLARSIKNGTKSEKSSPDYFDRNSHHETMSEQIKDHFTSLNLKLATAVPEDFKIYIDCKQFKSCEVKVGIKDNFIEVHAGHQHKFDDHGMIRREFTRRWPIPEDVKKDKVVCLLDRYGILTIRAPRKPTSITVPVQIETSQGWKTSEV